MFIDANDNTNAKIDLTGLADATLASGSVAGLLKLYELKIAVIYAISTATDASQKCTNVNAEGAEVCYDGMYANITCDSLRTTGTAATPWTVWNTVTCGWKLPATGTIVYDFKPINGTDVSNKDAA